MPSVILVNDNDKISIIFMKVGTKLRKIAAVHSLEPQHLLNIQKAAPGWMIVEGNDPLTQKEHLAEAEIIIG